jgi:hypothetical protein
MKARLTNVVCALAKWINVATHFYQSLSLDCSLASMAPTT